MKRNLNQKYDWEDYLSQPITTQGQQLQEFFLKKVTIVIEDRFCFIDISKLSDEE